MVEPGAVTVAPSRPGEPVRSFLNPDRQNLHAAVFYIQTCEYRVHVCHAEVRSVPSAAVHPRRSEATFQQWPFLMWGPRLGERGSNTGIVLRAQHAFSLRCDASKWPLISQS